MAQILNVCTALSSRDSSKICLLVTFHRTYDPLRNRDCFMVHVMEIKYSWGFITYFCHGCAFFKKLFKYLFIFERERKREREGAWAGRSRERGRHSIRSRLQTPSCQYRARCRAQTYKLQSHNLGRSQTLNWLSHAGAPWFFFLLKKFMNFGRERACMWGRGRERRRKKIPSRLHAQWAEPDPGLYLMTVRL